MNSRLNFILGIQNHDYLHLKVKSTLFIYHGTKAVKKL
jgi:hypothetical protein